MNNLHKKTQEITDIILKAKEKAEKETAHKDEVAFANKKSVKWPVDCIVGPGLEGAIACTSKIGYVNGSKGWLIYRGFNVFDLCAHSTFEEVSYLLLHGKLPTEKQLDKFSKKLIQYRNISSTIHTMMRFPLKNMNTMAALRLGTNLLRQSNTYIDKKEYKPDFDTQLSSDEDSIPMETKPMGEKHAIFEFKKGNHTDKKPEAIEGDLLEPVGFKTAGKLISAVASIAAAVARLRDNKFPIDSDPKLSFAANLIYMTTGKKPTPVQERVMDVALILHADHGMNASTFSTMVVASTLSDMYFAVGSGIAALNGPLHGGANAEVLKMLQSVGSPQKAASWCKKKMAKKEKIMGFGHRVYKAYDPRARVLGPLAKHLIKNSPDEKAKELLKTANAIENEVVNALGEKKGIFPNVDFYSGLVYSCLGIPVELFTPFFAVSRVSGWSARVIEYVKNNRIFRPRAIYTGDFDSKYIPINKR